MVLQTLRDLKPSNHFLYLCIVQFVYGFFFCNQYKLDPHSLSLLCHMTPSLTLFALNLGVLLAGCRVALVCHKSRHVHLIFQTGHTAFTIRKAILWFFFMIFVSSMSGISESSDSAPGISIVYSVSYVFMHKAKKEPIWRAICSLLNF